MDDGSGALMPAGNKLVFPENYLSPANCNRYPRTTPDPSVDASHAAHQYLRLDFTPVVEGRWDSVPPWGPCLCRRPNTKLI